MKLPVLQRGASVAKPSATPPKPPVFALQATPRSSVAIPLRVSTQGILAKARDDLCLEPISFLAREFSCFLVDKGGRKARPYSRSISAIRGGGVYPRQDDGAHRVIAHFLVDKVSMEAASMTN